MAAIDVVNSIYQGIAFAVLWFWWLFLLVWIFVMKFLYKNWKVEAVIIEKRGNNLIKSNDRATRYTDPYSGITGYRLQKAKDTIPIVNFDWVIHNVAVPTTFFERTVNLLRGNIGTIFLFRYGSRQYKPIKITKNGKTRIGYKESKDNEGNPVFVKVYEPIDPRKVMGSLDFEVIDWDNMNFMVQEQRASIERRRKKGEFWKGVLMPLAVLAITALICIVTLKFSFDYATSVRSSAGGSAPNPTAEQPNIPIVGNIVPGT